METATIFVGIDGAQARMDITVRSSGQQLSTLALPINWTTMPEVVGRVHARVTLRPPSPTRVVSVHRCRVSTYQWAVGSEMLGSDASA
jgi:hypothetical protein